MKKFYSFLFAMLFSVVAFAYDAEINGIYYDFDYENMTAKVTYKSDGIYYIGYKETEEIPDISFSPDANFPCIYAEKTIESLYLKQIYKGKENKRHDGLQPHVYSDCNVCQNAVPVSRTEPIYRRSGNLCAS